MLWRLGFENFNSLEIAGTFSTPFGPNLAKGVFKSFGLADVVAENASGHFCAQGLAELAAEGSILRKSNRFFDVGLFVFNSPFGVTDGGEE